MPALHLIATARVRSRRRWITGAVIAATLLAEVPRVADPDHAPDPVAACDRAAAAPRRRDPAPVVPIDPTAGQGAAWDGPGTRGASDHCAGLSYVPCAAATSSVALPAGVLLCGAAASGTAGASRRTALRHVIGL